MRNPGSRRALRRPLLLGAAALLGWATALAGAPAAQALSQLDLIVVGAETEKSFVQVNNGSKIDFSGPASYDVDLDFVAGTVRLENFFLPGFLQGIGVNFALTQVPSVLEGTLTVLEGGLAADLVFPSITLDFVRDFGYHGSLTVDLTTTSVVVPAGCAGRSSDQVIDGSSLDLLTGSIELVAAVCPQVAYYQNDPQYETTYDEAFRVFLRGSVAGAPIAVPEPGTLLMVSSGLAGLARVGRRRAGRRKTG